MARKKSVYVPVYNIPAGDPGTRIRIPQPVYRPVKLFSEDAVKREETRGKRIPGFVLHRRGIRRTFIGVDPQEARAVSLNYVRGSLFERIVYKALITFGWLPDADFDFQSSQSGGRMEFGGLVADFLFEDLMLIIQCQSDWHTMVLQEKRDEEQKMILEDMGYDMFYLEPDVILSDYRLENELRRIFGFNMSSGYGQQQEDVVHDTIWDHVFAETLIVHDKVDQLEEAWQL